LGGAVNLVTPKLTDSNAYVSIQRGSFGTYRAAATLGYHHKPSGFVIAGAGWFDDTRNDFPIDVEVSDKTGRYSPISVRRFHDHYRSYGGTLQLAVVGKSWAERLSLQLFGLAYEKQVQHDVIMARAIGEATNGATTMGATVRYEQSLRPNLHLSTVASLGRRTIRTYDVGKNVYDWRGFVSGTQDVAGELFREPHDSTIWQDSIFARPTLEWRIEPEHILRVSTTARFTGRTGQDPATKTPAGEDPQAGTRDVGTLISGIEYELNAFEMPDAKTGKQYNASSDNRFQNLVVLKHYFYDVVGRGVPVELTVQDLDTSGFRFGVGDSMRFRVTRNITAKASYELATRIPSIEEFFGDSLYIGPNLLLRPEYSHNVNAGMTFETRRTRFGNFTVEGDFFMRNVSNLIVLLAESIGTLQARNVEGSKTWGLEGAFKWISPGNWVVLDANGTWLDPRNVSTQGPFQKYDGQRIPNRPWLFANWSARFQWRKLLTSDDGISPYYNGRYIHTFFRNWEDEGDKDYKITIPTQVTHAIGISYFNNVPSRTSVSFEVDNLTDARLYDFFGVQKPGRAFSVKVTGEL
jgi:vitamin B12 transporter